jgi:dUTP pyrophosphatase
MSRPVLRIHRIRANATVPAYASGGAAGLDLTAAIDAPLIVEPLARVKVPTGRVIALPENHEGQVRPRSGLAAKHGLTVANAPGTIDEDYRGELMVLLVNLGNEPVTISPGDRIAQLVVAPITKVRVSEVAELAELGTTERGDGGFGSTGVQSPACSHGRITEAGND